MKKLSVHKIALRNIVAAVSADMANGAEYIQQHPLTHEDLPDRTVEAVERHMEKILDGLRRRFER